MASIRKEVKERVIKRLRLEQGRIKFSIDSNRRKINTLSAENTKLKRELAELEDLIRVTDT